MTEHEQRLLAALDKYLAGRVSEMTALELGRHVESQVDVLRDSLTRLQHDIATLRADFRAAGDPPRPA